MYETLIAAALSTHNLSVTHLPRALPVTPGVYAILHRDSGKIYIGSTCCRLGLRGRIREHRRDLRLKRHPNPHLQAYYDHHGIAAFDLLILEHTTAYNAREREQRYLQEHHPWDHGFNVLRVVDERWTHGPEVRAEAARKSSKPFALAYNGTLYEGVNLTAFCADRGLHQGAMTQVLLGKKIQYKGWTLPECGKPDRVCRYWPTGETVSVPYYAGTKVAKALNLHPVSFNKLLRGSLRVFKGWALASTELSDEELRVSMLPQADKCRMNGRKSSREFTEWV